MILKRPAESGMQTYIPQDVPQNNLLHANAGRCVVNRVWDHVPGTTRQSRLLRYRR